MKVTTFLLILFLSVDFSLAAQKKTTWIGGKLGVSIPTNTGQENEKFGFRNVAANGGLIAFTGRWFYAKRLSLGWDLGYETQKGRNKFWDVNKNGSVSASYHSVQLMAEGNYYFSHKQTRPYCGINFGVFLLMNQLNFNSAYDGTDADASVSYSAKTWKPGFAPNTGILFELSKKVLLDMNARFILIPNLQETYIQNENGLVTFNPHGAQNHFVISVGLFF